MNVFTVDVEHWRHATLESHDDLPEKEEREGVTRGLEIILKLLDQARVKATFFILGSLAGRLSDLVTYMQKAGHEIGSHGHEHCRVDQFTDDAFAKDLKNSRSALESLTGTPVVAYRAPMWSLAGAPRRLLPVLAESGFRYDSSLIPVRAAGNPRFPRTPCEIPTAGGTIIEIPPVVRPGFPTALPIGGTWGFRSLPFGVIARRIRRLNREKLPALFHFHPWEFDTERPALRQPFWTRVALTLRFGDLVERVERLLGEFPFTPLTRAVEGMALPSRPPESLP